MVGKAKAAVVQVLVVALSTARLRSLYPSSLLYLPRGGEDQATLTLGQEWPDGWTEEWPDKWPEEWPGEWPEELRKLLVWMRGRLKNAFATHV